MVGVEKDRKVGTGGSMGAKQNGEVETVGLAGVEEEQEGCRV